MYPLQIWLNNAYPQFIVNPAELILWAFTWIVCISAFVVAIWGWIASR